MRRTTPVLLAALFALAIGWATTAAGDKDHSHAGHTHHPIYLDQGKLFPATATVSSNDVVAWANYGDRYATIVFDGDVAKNLLCTRPSNFRLVNGKLESAPIRGHEFASVCSFKPGTYHYTVRLFDIAPNPAKDADLRGTLVVEPAA